MARKTFYDIQRRPTIEPLEIDRPRLREMAAALCILALMAAITPIAVAAFAT